MDVLPPPLRPETFDHLLQQWSTAPHYLESALIYTPDKSGLILRLRQLFNDLQLIKKYFPRKKIITIDVEAQALEDIEDLNLGKITQPTVLFLLGVDSLIDNNHTHVLHQLQELTSRVSLSVLAFVHHDFTHSNRRSALVDLHSFWQNTVVCGLYDQADSLQFIQYLEAKWHTRFPNHVKTTIVNQCGGHFWLVKACCRHIRDGGSIESLFIHDQLQHRLKTLWQRFLPSEQQVLEKIVVGQNTLTELEQHSRDFLLTAGWLQLSSTTLKLSIPLLKIFIQNLSHQALTIGADRVVYLNGINVSHLFSEPERSLLALVWTHKNRITPREQIAQTVWGENPESSYSDWALDQLVSRLRKKLQSLGVSRKWLLTRRKQGLIATDHVTA